MTHVVTTPPEEVPAPDGTKAAGWWHESTDSTRLVCDLCPRGCSLRLGDRGFCFVRENRDGQMVSTTYGRSTGFCVDPIEKKPLDHFYPGTPVLSFGTAGCNLGCRFCQNWTSSRSRDVQAACERATPETIAAAAVELDCRSVAFTYNDPIIFAEYAIDTARACRAVGLKTVAVTSGYIAEPARAAFFEEMDAANVDLKAFSDEFYRQYCGGQLEPVLDTLRWLVHHSPVWVEITNLIIPEANDSPEAIERLSRWVHDELGADVPLHFSAFHPDFKLVDRRATPHTTLVAAHETARQVGLHYVYTGNLSDPKRQSTYCPNCGKVVVERDGYFLGAYAIRNGRCRYCDTPIAGRFDDEPGTWGARRRPVRIADYAQSQAERTQPVEEGKVSSRPNDGPSPRAEQTARPALNPEQEQRVFWAAGRRVADTVYGRLAEPLEARLGEMAGLPLYGAFVSLKRGGRLRSCCGYLGQSLPLAEAVARAAERAAKEDPRFTPISSAELAHLDMEVWLLWNLQPIVGRGEDRAAAIAIGKHGLQIARGNARGLLLPGVAVDHGFDARSFLDQVCLKAGLPVGAWLDDNTAVMTFEGYAISGRMKPGEAAPAGVSAAPRPSTAELAAACTESRRTAGEAAGRGPGGEVRPAAVAGTFYPATAAEIDRQLDEMIPKHHPAQPWFAAMVPHAGWIYSGRLAAEVFSRIEIPERVIVLAPKHRAGGSEWAVAPYAAWSLPGGHVASDPDLARRLSEGIDGLELDAAPHREEHAIEVQLPLLARLAPQSRVVGITIGSGALPELLRFGRQMATVLRDDQPRPLLIVSSDMNHFADEAATRQVDRVALDALETLDPERLYQTVRANRITMCGVGSAVVVMETLRTWGCLDKFEEVGYTTSAEASGETRRVVGYAGVLLG